MRRGSSIIVLFFASCCLVSLLSSASGSIPWTSWIPNAYKNLGWTSNANVTCRIQNPIFNPMNGSSNDTVMYSQDIVNSNNDTLLVNYIDLENATGSYFTSNPFSQSVPQSYRSALDQEIKKYTNVTFSGSTVWDLVVFTFTEIWNERLSGFQITAIEQEIGGHQAVLLDYGSNIGLGFIAFVDMETKIGLVFDVARESTWKNSSIFTGLIQSFVVAFLAPLEEVMYTAFFDEFSIIASSMPAPASSISLTQETSFLNRTAFLAVVGPLMAQLPEVSWPFVLTWNQILLIIAIVGIIIVIIFYGITSYKKEKKMMPESGEHEQEIPF
ncbi:MAG TPA: hypothetical protein VKM55_23975 [Candidatus Lokiarchaeia archaeon]|nr:hypothetical protein [Candidatus Lokiarchaeia archaeon]